MSDEPATVVVKKGDENWHDGPGWYYWEEEYPEEGSCGAFPSRAAAVEHAEAQGHQTPGPQPASLVGAFPSREEAVQHALGTGYKVAGEPSRAELLMHEARFSDIWYAYPGPGPENRFGERWHAGVWTGPQHDLICVKRCKTNEEANRWLSPGANSIQEAVEAAVELRRKALAEESDV